MILDLDLGNSFLKWRCGGAAGRIAAAQLNPEALSETWRELQPRRVRLASVGGDEVVAMLSEFAAESWGVRVERAQSEVSQGGVVNSYRDPTRMGVDRWLAMLAAYRRVQGACCVVDCGSAITVDYVAADGRHLGGYIMPGLQLMCAGLLGNTRQIRVEALVQPDTRPGRSTEEAVTHGLHLMLVALAEKVVGDMRAQLGASASLLVTGGDGALFLQGAGCGELVPDLVLDGLAVALPGEE